MTYLNARANLSSIQELHAQFYKDKFNLPSLNEFIRHFSITNDNSELIVFGGVRPILEVIAVTNKEASNRDKHDALYKLLWACEETAKEFGKKELHCFPENDPTWRARLKKDGFQESKYPAFVLSID